MPEGSQLVASNHTLEVDLGKMPLFPGSYAVLAALSDRQNLVNYHEFVGPSFIVREHSMVDSRVGQLMLKGDLKIGSRE